MNYNKEVVKIAQELDENKLLRNLIELSTKLAPEDIQILLKYVEQIKRKERVYGLNLKN